MNSLFFKVKNLFLKIGSKFLILGVLSLFLFLLLPSFSTQLKASAHYSVGDYCSECGGKITYETALSSPNAEDQLVGSVNSATGHEAIFLHSPSFSKTDTLFHDCGSAKVYISKPDAYCFTPSAAPPAPAKNCSSRVCGDCDLDACLKMPGCSIFNSNKCGYSTGCYFNITKNTCENDTTQSTPCNWVPNSTKSNGFICEPKTSSSATPPPATPPPATPPPNDPDSCKNVDNDDHAFACQASCSGDYSQPYTKTPYNKCSTGQCCYNPAKYPRSQIGNPSGGSTGGGSTTPAPGGGTTSPSGGTPGPTSGPCQGVKGGVLSYVNGTCNEKLFDATKATAREFCGGVYKDKYICQNIDPATSQRYVDYIPSGGNTCSEAPWCPSTSTTTTPAPGPDAGCVAYQGQTCHPGDFSNKIYCCEPNKNLECVNPNPAQPNFTCQYKGGAAFTPTPGTAGNCSAANFGRWGAGCPCPAGGGCGTGVGCYREASGKTFPPDNSNGQFCAAGRWCAQSQTDVPNTAACLGSTPYSTPTPASGGGGYQADCPYYSPTGGLSNNECQDGTACLPGYDHAPIGPGGTNGDRVCSETNGRPNVCCTRRPGGSTGGGTTTTPAPGGGTTPPPATPPPASTYTPPSSCTGHPANSMCGSASEANTQCFYPGGTGYWGWKGEGNGCDLSSGTQTNCYVCTP